MSGTTDTEALSDSSDVLRRVAPSQYAQAVGLRWPGVQLATALSPASTNGLGFEIRETYERVNDDALLAGEAVASIKDVTSELLSQLASTTETLSRFALSLAGSISVVASNTEETDHEIGRMLLAAAGDSVDTSRRNDYDSGTT